MPLLREESSNGDAADDAVSPVVDDDTSAFFEHLRENPRAVVAELERDDNRRRRGLRHQRRYAPKPDLVDVLDLS